MHLFILSTIRPDTSLGISISFQTGGKCIDHLSATTSCPTPHLRTAMEHHNEVLICTWPIPGRLTWSRSPVCADLALRKRRSRFSPESCARAVRPFGCAGLAPVYLPVSLPGMCLSRPRAFAGSGSASLLCMRRSRSRVAPVLSRSPRTCGSSSSVCAGLAPGVCGPRSRVCAGLAPV